jgi:uncharacterized coiled-coil protein SlyX
MLGTWTRQFFVVTAVALVAALAASSALAAKGPGKLGPRAATMHGLYGFGLHGTGGPMMGIRGFGAGPMLGMRGPRGFGGPFGHHRRGHHGPGMLSGAILVRAASYIGITPAQLGAGLKDGKTLAELATANGKTAAGLVQALVDDAKAGLDAAVAAGWLSQAQADKAVERLTERITKLVNEGPKAPRGPLGAAATYLGVTPAELHTALRSGKSLAEIAADKGKTVEGLVAALLAEPEKRLDAAVAANRLTQAKADELLAKLTERVTAMVNRKPKAKPSAAATTTTALWFALKLKLA